MGPLFVMIVIYFSVSVLHGSNVLVLEYFMIKPNHYMLSCLTCQMRSAMAASEYTHSTNLVPAEKS